MQKADPAKMTPAIAQKIRQQLQRNKTTVLNQQEWIAQLKDRAEIEDYRSKVLR